MAGWSEIAPQANFKLSFCSVSVITYSFYLPAHSSPWTSFEAELYQIAKQRENWGAHFFSRSISSHFIHCVGSKSSKLNAVRGHHCRDNDCLFKVNLPFWLSPKTMFTKFYMFQFFHFQKILQNQIKTSFGIFGCLMPLQVCIWKKLLLYYVLIGNAYVNI